MSLFFPTILAPQPQRELVVDAALLDKYYLENDKSVVPSHMVLNDCEAPCVGILEEQVVAEPGKAGRARLSGTVDVRLDASFVSSKELNLHLKQNAERREKAKRQTTHTHAYVWRGLGIGDMRSRIQLANFCTHSLLFSRATALPTANIELDRARRERHENRRLRGDPAEVKVSCSDNALGFLTDLNGADALRLSLHRPKCWSCSAVSSTFPPSSCSTKSTSLRCDQAGNGCACLGIAQHSLHVHFRSNRWWKLSAAWLIISSLGQTTESMFVHVNAGIDILVLVDQLLTAFLAL